MPFKGWRNLLEVPIVSGHPLTTHPPNLYSSHIIDMPSSSRQRVNATRRAIEFNREASPLILSSLPVQISTRRTVRPLPSLSEAIPIVRRRRSTTYGMPILFWRPLVSVVVNCLGWRYLHTKRPCWQEVFVVGIGVKLRIGGWSRQWGIPVPLGRC